MFTKLPSGILPKLVVIWRSQGRVLIIIFIYALSLLLINHYTQWLVSDFSVEALSVVGIALSIFLGFRNNAAYDRWWEARKSWGSIVNYSRSWAMQVISLIKPSKNIDQKKRILVHTQIAWIYVLKCQLRNQPTTDVIKKWLPEIASEIETRTNKATALMQMQASAVEKIKEEERLSEYAAIQMNQTLVELFNQQGICERIKNTPFPPYYDFFTRFFLWTFILLLPLTLISLFDWLSLPLTILIGFVFSVIEATGRGTEDPFENRPTDTPMTSLCRTIEIDLLQMIDEKPPPALEPIKGHILM